MNHQYYYFVTGLPDFSFDSPKLPFTVAEFRVMLDTALLPEDKALLDRCFLKYDSNNLVALLKNGNATLNESGIFTPQQLKEVVEEATADTGFSNKNVPAFFADYIHVWLDKDAQGEWIWEDLMASFYMDYGMDSHNSVIARWFEFNLNIGNILSAIYARKYKMPIAETTVGNNDVAKTIRENTNARDFGLGATDVDYYEQLVHLSEETDIYERERKIDEFRWNWLTENTEFECFGVERIFAFLCKLQIVERWLQLNAEEGERVFRQLISDLKNEVEVPEE